MNLKKFSPQYYILSSTTIYCRSLPLITALLFQEEIEYTRALDDQDGSSFWRPSLLQFNNITFYLQVHYTLYTIHPFTRYSFYILHSTCTCRVIMETIKSIIYTLLVCLFVFLLVVCL